MEYEGSKAPRRWVQEVYNDGGRRWAWAFWGPGGLAWKMCLSLFAE